MATQTQTIHRTVVQPSRRHDYLYDPVYTLSSEQDHARTNMRAITDVSKVKRVPVYNTMFSELRHHPRFQIRLDTVDPVPKFISRQWRGTGSAARGAVLKLHGQTNFAASYQAHDDAQVTGVNRYKYFRRPLIPFNEPLGPEVILSSARQDPLSAGTNYGLDQQSSAAPLTKVAQTQTDYRDSDVQTDPYTPEYVVKPGTQPELVTLALLSHGCGLPAGLAEVEMIERARAKRAWEATLPDLHDVEQMDKRRKMMEQQELAEWALREKEIEKIQEERLKVLMALLKQREQQHDELNAKHLDRLWSKKQEDIKTKIDRIQSEHARTIRKLIERKKNVEGKLNRRGMIDLYADVGSQAYAPLTRVGVFLDRNSDQYVVRSKYLNSYEGLLELENSMPDFVLKPVVKAPRRVMTTGAGFLKRKYRDEKQLADIHQALQEEKQRRGEPPKPLRFLQKVEKPVPRPPTPSIDIPSQSDEEQELAATYLQQMLRGRSVQNMMYENKEKRIELIRELRSTHALFVANQQILKDERQATLLLQRQQQLFEQRESAIDESLAEVEGESLGDMLDFLSKELIRLQEERRIHAFSLLAERQRRIHEAEESGLRQVEERRRREHDEMFKQVVKVHQNTVDQYLEDVILSTVDRVADDQARREVKELAEQINDAAYAVEKQRTHLMSEEIVSELVHGFLLPEVQKQEMRDKVRQQQRKYLIAAHKEVYDNVQSTTPDQWQQRASSAGSARKDLRQTSADSSKSRASVASQRDGKASSLSLSAGGKQRTDSPRKTPAEVDVDNGADEERRDSVAREEPDDEEKTADEETEELENEDKERDEEVDEQHLSDSRQESPVVDESVNTARSGRSSRASHKSSSRQSSSRVA